MPHWRVTQRQDPHEVKCLDIQYYDSLATVVHRLLLSVIADAPHHFTGICPCLWPNCGMCFVPKLLYFLVALPDMAVGNNEAHLCFCEGTKGDHQAGWSEKFLPSRVLHGGPSTCLRVNLRFYVQFELMGTVRRSTSKTQSKPMAWSDAYKYFFFLLLFTKWNVLFCAEFIDAYIFKTTNNVNVYSEWVSFFSRY